MNYKYHMPTKVFFGNECILNNSGALAQYGKKAMLVTGRRSAKTNGSQDDVIAALQKEQMEYVVYDKVMSNPTIACCYEGAALAREQGADCIVAIGGGSPLDAAKAIALLARQDIKQEDLFSGQYGQDVLPIIAVPTTAGTGSEVTPYSVLMNDAVESKTSIGSEQLFPKIAFVDSRYMYGLPLEITVNTAVDALSHAMEGMISTRASAMSDGLAKESIDYFYQCASALCDAVARGDTTPITEDVREKLAHCSLLAGMVIAQTGTTAVHAMGYPLTYFKNYDHGRANGILLAAYLEFVEKGNPELVGNILNALQMRTAAQFKELMDALFRSREGVSEEDIIQYSARVIKTKNVNLCKVKPTEQDLIAIYESSFGLQGSGD